jgi:hypothetical protein
MNIRKLWILMLCFYLTNGIANSQNFNWIIPNKTYLKLYISEDGIYRVAQNDFVQAGINTSIIDPRTVKVFYKGTEIPLFFEGEQDGSFDVNDYLDFYASRNYGGLTNTYLASFGPTILNYTTNEYFNLYSDTSVYWIGWDGANGLRYTSSNFTTQIPYPQNSFNDKIHFEVDSLYSLGETTNSNSDYRYFNTEKISGEGWYWANLFANQSVSKSFDLPFLNPGTQSCTFRIFAFPNSRDTSFNEHKLVLRVNSNIISTIAKNDYERFDTTISFSSSLLQASGNTVSVTYEPTFGNPQATPNLYFDLIELTYPRIFKFSNNVCSYNLAGNDTTSAKFTLTGFNSSNPVFIYDYKNHIKITSFSSDSDTLFFTGKSNGSFEIINKTLPKKPFRITSRQVPNLVSSAAGADYIVIYNSLFESQAEQLRSHRQSVDNFRSIKASIEDVTDIFNFGMENPIAVRRFLKNAYDTWPGEKIKFVCLMGRGSLDPKNNRGAQSYYRNFIPVYGNPLSDGYFVNFNLNGFSYFQQVAIGRLPVYSQQEAQDAVNKIIDYDSQRLTPQNWWKHFVMITGGPNRNEQIQYQTQSNALINSYIAVPPVSGSPSRIYRNDSAGYITFNYEDSIKNEINRGGLFTNFIGHAASQNWELGLEDPSILNNGFKLPMVLSMTCFTGRNAEPNLRGFGEKFVYLPNKGAIGFLGSTGWSFSGAGNEINKYVMQGFSQDTLRRMGDLVKYSSNFLIPDTISFQVRNMMNSYNLLGDPAIKLLLPSTPEFIIGSTDYRLSNPYPLVGENVNLTIYPKNLGLYAKDCQIRFEILRNGAQFRIKDTTITNFEYLDTAAYSFSLDTIGNYSLRITLDPNDQYPQEIPTNNVLNLPLPLRNISYTPLKPIYNSVITTDSVEFLGLNPQVDLRTNNVKVLLQVDTNRNFTNPLLNYSSTNISGVATKLKYRIPLADTNIVFFWRTNALINNDSAGWSETMRFIYNPVVSASRMIPNDSVITLYPHLQGQFNPNEVTGLNYTGTGYALLTSQGQLQVKSHGNNGDEASYFRMPGYTLFIDGGSNPGLNIVKARRLTGKLVEFRNFYMNSSTSSDSVLAFLNTFDTTHYLMVAISSFTQNSDSLRPDCKLKFKQFGSQMVDSVTNFASFFTWAFIGILNSPPISGAEDFHKPHPSCLNNYCPSFATVNSTFLSTFGSINFSIGPAHRWKYFQWNRLLTTGSAVNFNVSAISRTGTLVPLYQNLSNNQLVNLDTLNSFEYPDLRLTALVSIDTLTGLVSPEFRALYFKYTPPCEIIPDNYSFVRSDSVVDEGKDVTISVKNYNIGFVPAGTVVYKWTANAPSGLVVLKADTVYIPLQPDSSRTSTVTFNTEGLKDPNTTIDTLNINFEVSLLNNQNDYYPFNNFAFTNIIIIGDSTGPSIEVTYDGKKIINGELIPAKPEIVFKFFDESEIAYGIQDTAGIFIRLDGRRIYYTIDGNPNPDITFTAPNNGNLKTMVTYKPTLSEGSHIFQYIGSDREGNRDTVRNDASVTNAFQVRDLYNYPNPMQGETYFTFNLWSSESAQKCTIKIYTVAGRLIKEISAQASVGFNQIYWDGRDNDGETMANGIYLYKLILEDEGKTTTSIQKLAILK